MNLKIVLFVSNIWLNMEYMQNLHRVYLLLAQKKSEITDTGGWKGPSPTIFIKTICTFITWNTCIYNTFIN
jgi:hypothetical protein